MAAVTTQRPCSFACLARQGGRNTLRRGGGHGWGSSLWMLWFIHSWTVFMKKASWHWQQSEDENRCVIMQTNKRWSSDIILIYFNLYFSSWSAALVEFCLMAFIKKKKYKSLVNSKLSPLFKTYLKKTLRYFWPHSDFKYIFNSLEFWAVVWISLVILQLHLLSQS